MVTEKNNYPQNKKPNQTNFQLGKLPPQAIEVEQAVLGALMLERDTLHKISDIIDTESFYKNEHQIIFDAIKKLSNENKPIDLLTVTMSLVDTQKIEEIGGPMYVTELTSKVASAAHIEFHARIIAQKFIQRELIRISSEIQTESYDESIDIDDLISTARTKLNEVDNLVLCSNAGQTSAIVASEAIREIESDCKATESGISPGITTGLFDLNRALGGWRNTNLIILAARPSIGKTSLALHFARIAAMSGKWVNFYGLEMKNADFYRILLSGVTTVSRSDIRDGKLTSNDWNEIHNATNTLEKLPIIWNDLAGITVNQIRSNTIRNNRAGKCDLVIIDYLQLIKPTDRKAIREQQIAEISRTLKETALGVNIPVICLAQLNRDVDKRADKEPNLSDLRESGSIEQDADVVLFLFDNEGLKLKVGKNRRGKVGLIDFWANEEKTKFADKEESCFDYDKPLNQPSSKVTPNSSFYEKQDTPQDVPF